MSSQVDETIEAERQVVFAGHSSGGLMAIFSTLWFLKNYSRVDCIATYRCVTFGSPLVANHISPDVANREN